MNKIYLIEYTAYDGAGREIKSGVTRARKATCGVHAQIRFEEYLSKTLPGFARLVVHSCREDNNPMSIFGDTFGDIFR
ncbi:MAG TPA: hypothetical protein P5531_03905 [Bacteroidales bacterium]|nr:hypothetical protein [Bacteroidales bacterium]